MTEQYQQASINLLPAASVFLAGIGSSNVAIPGAVVTGLPLQNVLRSGSLFRHTVGSSEVEFLAGGLVEMNWKVSINVDSGGRKNSQTTLFLDSNDGGGFLPVDLSFGYGYHRNTGQGRDTTGGFAFFNVQPGFRVEIASQRIAGTGGLEFIASSSLVSIGLAPDQ